MRTTAIMKRIFQEMVRDKRTMALLFVAPLLILTLMYFFFNGEVGDPKLGVVNIDDSLVEILEKQDIRIQSYEKSDKAIVIDDNLDGMLKLEDGVYTLLLQNSDPSSAKTLRLKVNQAITAQAQANLAGQLGVNLNLTENNVSTEYVYGDGDSGYFDILGPILIGFFVFFFVFLISGVSLLKERTSGTLERLMSTPVRRWEILTAYLAGYGVFAVIQTVIVVTYSVTVLDVVLAGSIWHVILINLLLALVALTIGTLLSTFASSEFQMVQFIPIVVIPQIFFVGIIPIEWMADWLQVLGKFMPVYYGADALKAVMYKGEGLSAISGDLLALVVFALVFIILNLLSLRRYRRL